MRPIPVLAATMVLVAGAAALAASFDIGPAIGSRAPALKVVDSAGKPQSIKTLAGEKGVVLVFFRSAKWCPYCQAQLIEMKAAPAVLASRGYRLAALSYDDPAVLGAFAAKREINFPLLSDKGSRTIDAWAMRDPQYKSDSPAYGVPMPGIFVLGADGKMKAKLAEAGYKTRPPLEAVLAAIDALPAK